MSISIENTSLSVKMENVITPFVPLSESVAETCTIDVPMDTSSSTTAVYDRLVKAGALSFISSTMSVKLALAERFGSPRSVATTVTVCRTPVS